MFSKQILFLLICCASISPILAQTEDTLTTTQRTIQKTQEDLPQNIEKEIIVAAQRKLDRSISILNIATALIVIALLIVIGVGILEYRRWRVTRYQREASKKSLADMSPIIEGLIKAKGEADKIVSQLPSLSLTEKPSEEIKEKLDEYARRIELLEMFGIPLKSEDYVNLGRDLFYKGKYALTLKALDKGIELKPDYDKAWNIKGAALLKLGRSEEAIGSFDKAIELKPDYAEAWLNKGNALNKLGRYKEALKVYDKVIELKPDYAEAWYNRGFALGDLGRYEEELKAYDKAIELKPDLAEAWNNKGFTLLKLDRYEEALKTFEKVIALKPDNADAWYNRACAYSLKGDKGSALRNLSKAIELDGKNREKAKEDEDFKNLWDDKNFKKIIS